MSCVGLVPLREANLEDVPASLEVGLLAELRKQILLLPDGQVKRAFGKILNPECLLTMLNNKSSLMRTAVIRVCMCVAYVRVCVTVYSNCLGTGRVFQQSPRVNQDGVYCNEGFRPLGLAGQSTTLRHKISTNQICPNS